MTFPQVQRASLGVQIAEDGVMAQIAQRVAARGGKLPQGVLVMGVNPGSPAEGAGIRPTTRVRSLALLLFLPLHFASRYNIFGATCARARVLMCLCGRVCQNARGGVVIGDIITSIAGVPTPQVEDLM